MNDGATNAAPNPANVARLLETLEARFHENSLRHLGVTWAEVREKIVLRENKLRSLLWMEATGGEPDLWAYDRARGLYVFCDCSKESPSGRRGLCYDRAALEARKTAKPSDGAMDLAAEMGVEILEEAQYFALQRLGNFDEKTSSWLRTPQAIRERGGALFGDRRYGRVFVYCNGAESYFAARGFRVQLTI